MSKNIEDLIKHKHSNEEPDSVVDRQPQSNFSILTVIIALFIVYLLLTVLFNEESVIKSSKDLITSIEVTPNKQNNKPIEVSNLHNIHQLIPSGSLSDIEQQLQQLDSESINEVVAGMTPIMLAASRGSVEIIDLLFTQGADPNKRGSMERTALQYATEKNHIEAATRLLSYGADIDAYDNGRLTPLVMAASRGYTELCLLFIEKGADVNIQHIEGWTALIDAAAHGDVKLVKALLEAGADKEIAAKNGKKAIDYAKEYGFKNIVRMLSK